MADYRIKAQKTGPRPFIKELQMISYRGSFLYTESGSPLIAEKQVYYPPDYLASNATSVVLDPKSYRLDGLSKENSFSRGRPAALPIEEQFKEGSEVSRSLLGIDRAETQQGLFGNVSSYGLDKKDWVAYAGWPDHRQGGNWEYKNSPAGPHNATRDFDDAKNSSIVLDCYPVPFYNPGNQPVSRAIIGGGFSGSAGTTWSKYLQGLVAMYIIEYMSNNFTTQQKAAFRMEYIENNYPKENGVFNRLYWDRIWTDIDQSRVGGDGNIPILPLGELRNFGSINSDETEFLDLTDADLFGAGVSSFSDLNNVDVYFGNFFYGATRHQWTEPDKGHYRIKTNNVADVWSEYFGMSYADLPDDLKNWEFRVLTSEPGVDSPEVKYKLPYYLITDSTTPSESLIFGASWPKSYSDNTIPQVTEKLTEGNAIGSRKSSYAVQTLQSTRAFRYQPGRISGFTYGVRVAEEGAGPGTVLEFGVENYSDGYFFRLKDGTDFSVVRRSTVPLGTTDLFIEANYQEREAFVNRLTGVTTYKDVMTATEINSAEQAVQSGEKYLIYETSVEQNIMNGDGLNNQGPSGYIYNPDTVTMYKIEFGWYGAIGAKFYAYIPQDKGEGRWVTLHTLVIENQIGQPCLQDPYFFFKYRVFVEDPSAIKLPQFVEKYGASYYIDGGDEGTVQLGSGGAVNRPILDAELADYANEGANFPVYKYSSVLGLKPKRIITNSEGNEFFNKKEIFPISMSVFSNKNCEIRFVNQYGCQEHAYTFQEGYRCEVPESQTLRAQVLINYLETDETALEDIGRAEQPTPTITFSGDSSIDTAYNLQGGVSGGAFIGWNGLDGGLLGSKIIADKVYGAYINPTENTSFMDVEGNTTIIGRKTRDAEFMGRTKMSNYANSPLLFRYPSAIDVKLSPYRRDTTLLSTIDIETEEFYILFTDRRSGIGYDTYENASAGPDFELTCNGGGRCDGKHAADLQIGIVWPYGEEGDTPGYSLYPKNLINRSNVGTNFGILDPKDSDAQTYTWVSSKEVEVVNDSGTGPYVKDRQIPNADNFRYFEGLPIDFEDSSVKDNVIIANNIGWVRVGNALEVGEGFGDGLGHIDGQLPGVPGEDGGRCRGLFVQAGLVEENAKFIEEPGPLYYLSKSTRWDSGLTGSGVTLFATNSSFVTNTYAATGADQILKEITGTNIREFWLPVTISAGSSAFGEDELIVVKYRAIAMYEPSLLSDTARPLERRITGANPFPLRVFIKMRDGSEIGSVVIAKKTPNGFVNSPFTPHGCTLSVGESGADTHDGGASDASLGAIKTMGVFSHPDTLNPISNYSYIDTSGSNLIDKTKKCSSFLSKNSLDGAGFSGTGDYPLRFLKFKDSGDPVGSFYISAGKPQEISLEEIFNFNGESVTPSFWSNRALFMIARDISTDVGDPNPGVSGRMSVTLNYKEQ